jgi:hypothetical protein
MSYIFPPLCVIANTLNASHDFYTEHCTRAVIPHVLASTPTIVLSLLITWLFPPGNSNASNTMARLQFSHVYIWGEPPATPAHTFQQQEQDDNCDNGPQSPCNFMPQSSEPVMCLSSTTRRTRKSVDERAIRLLLPTRNGKSQQTLRIDQ